jgi:hypothetical protein
MLMTQTEMNQFLEPNQPSVPRPVQQIGLAGEPGQGPLWRPNQ